MRPRLLLQVLSSLLLGGAAAALQPASAQSGASISGVVHDSLAGAPLAGATVQLVATDSVRTVLRTATTDPDGRFVLDAVPPGRYQLGFLHPVVDSLGFAPVAREVTVGGTDLEVELGLPSPARLRATLCVEGADAAAGLVLGVVRTAGSHAPAAAATVDGQWLEYDLRKGAITRRVGGRSDTTAANGSFALCGVPRGGSLVLRAWQGADTTAPVELRVPDDGFVRRDLYLAAGDAAGERLRGRVTAVEGGGPIHGARVVVLDGADAIASGVETTTDERGAWVLPPVAAGTRLVEVRAIGYYPQRVVVDVVQGAPPVETPLFTMRAMLDTVRVTASRIRLQGTGFEDRRRSGMGRYLTSEELLRRTTMFTSDAFLTMPGVRVERSSLGDTFITMRGAFGPCVPAIYIDGHHLQHFSADDMNAFVSPDEVAGIEVYTGAMVPPEFSPGLTGCGSIVLWTKPGENPVRRWSMRRRALQGAGAILLGVAAGLLFAQL